MLCYACTWRVDSLAVPIWSSIFPRWWVESFIFISSACQCIQRKSHNIWTAKGSKMWMSALWRMWHSMHSHSQDHWWDWRNNDQSLIIGTLIPSLATNLCKQLTRYQDLITILTYLSPATTRLQRDIASNSAQKNVFVVVRRYMSQRNQCCTTLIGL